MAPQTDQSAVLLANIEPDNDDHEMSWATIDAHEKALGYSQPRGWLSALLSRLERFARHNLPSSFSWPELRSLLLSTAIFLLPSFLQHRFRPIDPNAKAPRKHDTAYLDGMRGVSALIVFFCHFAMSTYWPDLVYGYGYHNSQHPRWSYHSIWRLPIVRLMYVGDPMVTTFFVVSGYALSYKPLQDMRAERYDKLLDTLASGTLRRALRLYLPVAAATLLICLSAQFGLYEPTRAIVMDESNPVVSGVQGAHFEAEANIFIMLGKWAYGVYRLMEIWNWGPRWDFVNFSGVLWTIPTEFIGSLFLFITQVGVAKMRPRIRMAVVAFITAVAFQKNYWAMALFLAGMLVAELEMERVDARRAAGHVLPQSRLVTGAWVGLYVFSLFLMSQPDEPLQTPGWRWLGQWLPEMMEAKRFYTSIGSFTLVLATSNVEGLKRIYDNPISAYLGKISFALYLTHTLLVAIMGYAWMALWWSIFGYATPAMTATSLVLSSLCTLVFAIWLADVFWRVADTPSIKLARWVERILTSRPR